MPRTVAGLAARGTLQRPSMRGSVEEQLAAEVVAQSDAAAAEREKVHHLLVERQVQMARIAELEQQVQALAPPPRS